VPDDTMKQVLEALEDIKAILLLTGNSSIEEAKKKLLKDGSEERKIYDLCREGRTNEELAAAAGKDAAYVRSVISTLRQKGLVKTVERDGKKVHEQRF